MLSISSFSVLRCIGVRTKPSDSIYAEAVVGVFHRQVQGGGLIHLPGVCCDDAIVNKNALHLPTNSWGLESNVTVHVSIVCRDIAQCLANPGNGGIHSSRQHQDADGAQEQASSGASPTIR
jgi:hypothetical protein